MSASEATGGSRLVEIGRIVAPHGIAGQVKVKVPDPATSALLTVGAVFVVRDRARVCRRVLRAAPSSGAVVVALEGVDNRDAAEALRGSAVFVEEKDMPRLPDGEYYLYELRGMTVEDAHGAARGAVTDLSTNHAQDLLVVAGADGREHLVPFVNGLIEKVDRARGVITLAPLEGLFE